MPNSLILILTPLFLCWGSFLNVVAYRLVHEDFLHYSRSRCPACKHTLAWYDLIPIISWLCLRGACRYCKNTISYLYPFIEILTAVAMNILLLKVSYIFFPAYFLFFSALIVTIRTDLETMLISRYMTLFALPIFFIVSAVGKLPITFMQSVCGASIGFFLLWFISWLFFTFTGKKGMGEGDFDLLALIGSVTGPLGAWVVLMISSIMGSFIGITYSLYSKPTTQIKIPYGPFLALAAMLYVLYQQELVQLLIRY